jgi:tetratricopeptide (TPR) repeat protein
MKLKLFLIATIFISQIKLSSVENLKPYGLLTDLIEHTDKTWLNGYPTNTPVWKLNEAIESLQYVEIASAYPTFGWIVPEISQGTKQTAYRIIVADSYDKALAGEGNVWDSGEVESKQSTSIRYAGEALQAGKNYFWRVKTVTNAERTSEWSDVKSFRTASSLKQYAVSVYPLVKTLEQPVSSRKVTQNTYFFDFGKDAFGQLIVNLSSETGQDSVVVHLGECITSENRIDRNPTGTIRYRQQTLHLMKGSHTYHIKIKKDTRNTNPGAILMPGYIGEVLPFRYCEVENYGKPLPTNNILRESVHYPFDESASSFRSSNDILNQIWDLSKYSIKATSFAGVYVDGDRERIPYEADALINQLGHYGVDKEYTLARRSYEYLLEYPTWPTEWILQGVMLAWNDYLYTGDNRSLEANYEILKIRSLPALTEKNGFISTTTGLQTPEFIRSIRREPVRDIVDWPHSENDEFDYTDYNVVTNAYRYEALKRLAQIAEAIGRTDEATDYAKQAEKFKLQFNKSFFNGKTGIYKDGVTSGHSSLHANMFPLVFGMVENSKKQKIIDFIQSRKMACSVYGSQFLMDALYEAGDSEYALYMLTKTDDRSWYNMIRAGSTISLEAWDNKYKPNQDWNHAWGAAPANIIPRRLMGVEPLTPGFGTARIKPQTGSLEFAEAIIPSIKGEIRLSITNGKGKYTMQLNIPANMDAEVYLPLPQGKYEIRCNQQIIKASPVKGEAFIYAGKFVSGTYIIEMIY